MEVFKEALKWGVPADSGTVDSVRPNDLGFACMVKVFGEVIKKMLEISIYSSSADIQLCFIDFGVCPNTLRYALWKVLSLAKPHFLATSATVSSPRISSSLARSILFFSI